MDSFAFTEGYDAQRRGIPRGANPHVTSGPAWESWRQGWDSSAEDRRLELLLHPRAA